jgi:N6-adenosine-specific RNA methylase IME4
MQRYGVIVADPPWSYRNRQEGAAENHYPTMTNAEIAALPISELAADDAVLLL